MRSAWAYTVASIIVALVTTAGCAETSSSAAYAADSENSGSTLVVYPSQEVVLGFFQEQKFEIDMTDENGVGLASQPVSVGVMGSAHNADLEALDLLTDEQGSCSVIFQAPSVESSFEIRFSSPAAKGEVMVPVSVDPSVFSFTLNTSYQGVRDIQSTRASVFEGSVCESAGGGEDDELAEMEEVSAQDGIIPGTHYFEGLLFENLYSVVLTGRDAQGHILARACMSGISADGAVIDLELEDMDLDPVGIFNLETEVTNADTLHPVASEVLDSLDPFSQDVSSAILGAIRSRLSDAASQSAFDSVRVSASLDALMVQDFVARGVDVSAFLMGLEQSAFAELDTLTLLSTLELGSQNDPDGAHDFVHSFQHFEFSSADTYAPAMAGNGYGAAYWNQNSPDVLLLGEHTLVAGLGGVIEHVLVELLGGSAGAGALEGALEGEVDCSAVTTLLATPLSSVTDPLTILTGCQDAMTSAQGLLDAQIAITNTEYSSVKLEGSCVAVPTGEDLTVSGFVNGTLAITWEGTETLGVVSAEFDGQPAS